MARGDQNPGIFCYGLALKCKRTHGQKGIRNPSVDEISRTTGDTKGSSYLLQVNIFYWKLC